MIPLRHTKCACYFGIARREPMEMPRPDRHDEIEINFLDRGTLTYLIGGDRITVASQQLALFWAAVPHQIIEFHNVSYYYVLTIPFGWMLEWSLPAKLLSALIAGQFVREPIGDRSGTDQQLFCRWQEDFLEESPLMQEVVLLEVRARLLRLGQEMESDTSSDFSLAASNPQSTPPNRDKAEAMACYVARNYSSRLQIKDIAAHAGLHPDYAATLFRKTFGTTLNKLITQHRIAHAQRQLVSTNDQIVHIAHDSGFDSLSRFNDAFKRLTGVTPRQYRKNHSQHIVR
jgi:AraC family transcriptional regulator, melibiose operon regulatory protein